MQKQNEMFFVTARIMISLPFVTSLKDGDFYEVIELNDTAKIKIYPLEYVGTIKPSNAGSYVSALRKLRIDVTLPIESKEASFSNRESQRPFLDIVQII